MSTNRVAECRYCHQWQISVDDTYCGFCGRLQLLLELDKESIVLISTLAPEKVLKLRNDSTHHMTVEIRPREGAPIPGIAFEPGPRLEIGPKSEVAVRVGVDANQLPAGFQRVTDYACIVDGDTRKQRAVRFDVRSGPRPKLFTPTLDFQDIEEGKGVERSIHLANTGSVTLSIRAVRVNGNPHLTIRGDYAKHRIAAGERLSISVLWETKSGATFDPKASGVQIEFDNYPEPLLIPANARIYRYRIDAQPATVRFSQALAKRDHAMTVRLENQGTTDVEVLAIESNQPWIHILSRAAQFTLLCDDPAKTNPLSPTTFLRTFEFRVLCRPTELAKGKHDGTVTIRPRGQASISIPVEITVVEPREYHDYVGIDFGTTNSVVAVLSSDHDSGVDLVKDDLSGRELIPSVLVFDDPETYKIGQAARNEADTAPDRTVRSIKRVMGYERERDFFDRSYTAAELASLIIRRLVQLAEQKIHTDSTNGHHYTIRRAIITVPANFHDLQIRDVLAACEAAGLDTEEERARKVAAHTSSVIGAMVNAGVILDEPSAAVLYYLDFLRRRRKASDIMQAIAREQGLKLLVFDYGGGTLDVAIATATQLPGGGTGLRIITSLGNNEIGGDYIDVLFMQELLRRCQDLSLPHFEFETSLVSCTFRELQRRCDAEGWSRETWRELLRIRAQWKDLAEQTKIRIAEDKQTPIDIPPDLIVRLTSSGLDKSTRAVKIAPLPNDTIHNILQPVLARCRSLIERLLSLAGVNASEIDYILHTGRQSLLPQIRGCVRDLFPELADDRDLLEQEHLKICVAKGAALYGSMRNRLVTPDAKIVLLSDGRRLPHSYGVETFTNPVEPELDEIIERGEQYPVERTKTYPAAMIPPSGTLNLKFYQNNGTDIRIIGNRDVTLIGQISIETSSTDGCDVTFSVSANRTLNVEANGRPVTIEPARLHEEESWMG
ncbi:MAG: Hsp70 family protein [Thermoanaerobaculia bacterium]